MKKIFLLVLIVHLNFQNMFKYSLGIDISAKDFHCCISFIDHQQTVKVVATSKFSNANQGYKSLEAWIKKHRKEKEVPMVIVMEATGVYFENCALYLFKAGYSVSVVLPNKAKKYLQATGLKSKNDKIDAKGLARMGAEQSLDLWQPMSEFFFALRGLTRQLQSLQELKTSVSNQLHAAELSMYPVKMVIRQLKDLIKTTEKQISAIEQAIESHIHSNKVVAEKVEQLCSIKGVGITTAAVLLGETNGFALFESATQLTSYVGYDVIENQSGQRVGKTRISKKGNARIRRILHLPAFNVVKYQVAPFSNLFNRTYHKHGIKMKSYVAVQKKLLLILYALWKRNEKFILQSNAEEEQVLPSRLPFCERQKNSPSVRGTTQGKQTHEVSQFASSRLSQS